MKFYWLRPPETPIHTGEYSASHKWGLPGISCPACQATWSDGSDAYPCADVSVLAERDKFSARLEKDYTEFERLCALVRPLVPEGVRLWPGTKFGPLVGSARGSFGQLFMQDDPTLLVRHESLEQLQTEGVRGLVGCRAELRFRQKSAPVLLELQAEPHGLLHPDCLPADRKPPCGRCGRQGLRRPEHPVLDAASLPGGRDLFRLAHFRTMLIGTERLVDTARRLGFEGVDFHELPVC